MIIIYPYYISLLLVLYNTAALLWPFCGPSYAACRCTGSSCCPVARWPRAAPCAMPGTGLRPAWERQSDLSDLGDLGDAGYQLLDAIAAAWQRRKT